jgi:4-diphosphocytidyl-2-C-methyl-D-erythritol kinase
MIRFPHAKINLGLSIISKRADGFHDLETLFYTLPLRDILEIIPAAALAFFSSGLALSGDPNDNLVLRAYKLLKNHFPQIGPLEIHLHKSIPSGAGLGGGSSDAVCMLTLLNDFFILNIPQEKLAAFALELGSDCPYFLRSSPCYARGRGEILEPATLDLSGYSILLVHPEEPVSTVWAFSQIRPVSAKFAIKELISGPVSNWRDRLLNDFEIPVFQKYPQLQKMKMQLYEAGALYASMTGSGSTLYGIFKKNQIPAGGIDVSLRQSFLP